MADDEGVEFFQRALEESKSADSMERAGYVKLPESYRSELLTKVTSSMANSKLFLSMLNKPATDSGDEKFQDTDFPHDRHSLIRRWELADIAAQIEWANFTWRRLSDVFQNLCVFHDIDPSDIKQGALGDCYFLSTLSALAEKSSRIAYLFNTPDVTKNAQYKVKMMEMGHWQEIVVDDYMPMKSETELAFSGPKIEKGVVEMWVLLLEKAWAKKFGCYYDIQAGFAEEALTDLTGAPCKIVPRSDPHWWEEIASADQRNYIITAGCVGRGVAQEDKIKYERLGLILDHAYAVISAREVVVRGDVIKLLKIRNPWGKFEWVGDWSDNSTKWTDEAKQELNVTSANDGTFWMSFDDFQKYFESCTVCLVEDTYLTTSMAMDQTKKEDFSVVEVTLENPQTFYFMVCQVDERRLGGLEGGYTYSPCRIIAARLLERGGLEYLSSKASVSTRDTWVKLSLEPGIYLFYVDFEWRSDATDLFGVSVYSDGTPVLRDVTSQYSDYLERCFTPNFLCSCLMVTASESSMFRYRTYKLIGKAENGDLLPGLYFDLFENLSDRDRLLMCVKHSPWDNMRILHIQNSQGAFQFEVEPGGYRVIIKKQVRLQDRHGFKVLMKKVFVPSI